MQFKPKTEKELAEAGLLQPGKYPFEVIEAKDTISKASGNDMIALKLRVFDGARQQIINDYLLESVAHKLRHACDVMGLLEDYNSGELKADSLVGKSGWVKIAIKKDKTGQYNDSNEVKDYVAEKDEKAESHIKAKSNGYAPQVDADGDDIPF